MSVAFVPQKQPNRLEEQVVRPRRQLFADRRRKARVGCDHAFLDLVATKSGAAEGGSQLMSQGCLARTAGPGDDDQRRYADWPTICLACAFSCPMQSAIPGVPR